MDWLGAIFEALVGYFGPAYLAFTLVMGYLWFFLFFFKTEHWDRLEWAERFFFGFLIGFFSMAAFALITGSLMVFLVAIYSEHFVASILYLAPICFTIFLAFFRGSLETPLGSEKAKDYLLKFLKNHRSYWPYLVVTFSVTTYFGLGWNNPFFNDASRSLWLGFTIFMHISIFSFCMLITYFVTQLSCLSFMPTSVENVMGLLAMIFKFLFLSFQKRDMHANGTGAKKRKRHSRITMFLKGGVSFLNNDFFHKVLLVAFLSIVIVLADGAFHLFSPAMEVVETDCEAVKIEVFKYFQASMIYTTEVVKTYRVSLPLFPVRYLNLSISNPSNFSVYDGSKYLTWEERPYAMLIEADPSLSYTVVTNPEGKIESININTPPRNTLKTNHQSFITLTYKYQLSLELIKVTKPKEENLGNGSISVTMSLVVNNTESRPLSSDEFSLFEVGDYGNLTSFTLYKNGTKITSEANFIRDQWLWISFRVNEHSFLNLTVSAVFEEMTT